MTATHTADSHDIIRVQGARENNLKDVSVELPKRRLTVFTGVSGSGKSSLVFATIAAESQRMINETYSAFVQGFMPTLARPEVDVSALYDDSKSLNEGALTIPGYSMDGWYGRIFKGSGFFDPDKPIKKFNKRELHDLLYKEPTKIKVEGINLTYAGLIPSIQRSMLSKDVDSLQPHIRAFVERTVTFTTCPDCGGTRLAETARSSKIAGVNIADACAMQISDLAAWVRGLDEPSVAPLVSRSPPALTATAPG